LKQFKNEKSEIIKALHALQNAHPQHFLPPESLNAVAKYFNVTKAYVYGVVTYYSMFSTKPRGKYIVRVCESPVCHMMGSTSLLSYIQERWGLLPGSTTKDNKITLETTECIGMCNKAPAMIINDTVYTNLTPEIIEEIWSNLI
jgi:NADH-quinone oxidoreductase subunit E